MRFLYKIIFALIISAFGINAQTANFQWAKGIGGSFDDIGESIVVDGAGNLYTSGAFSATVDFDPGPGTFTMSAISSSDIFITKFDASGNFIWAKQMKGNLYGDCSSIKLDASGNLNACGCFAGTIDFDPGIGTYTINGGSYSSYVLKLDPNGNLLWAKQFSADVIYKLDVDVFGNVYSTGGFVGSVDFDPGVAVYNLTSVNGYHDAFISKLDANGNFIWARQFSSISVDEGYCITSDALGNTYTSGSFMGTIDFDPSAATLNLTPIGVSDAFILKLDPAGDLIWVKQIGNLDGGFSLAVDKHNNIYSTSCFQSTVDFDPGAGVFNLTSAGSDDIYILKLDSAGNFKWAKRFGSPLQDIARSLSLDGSGNVYSTGTFKGVTDFDPSATTYTLASVGSDDVYVSKLDSTGNFIWAKQFGGVLADQGYWLTLDASDNIYTVGVYSSSANFDIGISNFSLTSNGGGDIFIHKMSQGFAGIKEVNSFASDFIIGPNPNAGIVSIEILNNDFVSNDLEIKIINVFGQEVKTQKLISKKQEINLSETSNGIYNLNLLENGSLLTSKKIIIQK